MSLLHLEVASKLDHGGMLSKCPPLRSNSDDKHIWTDRPPFYIFTVLTERMNTYNDFLSTSKVAAQPQV